MKILHYISSIDESSGDVGAYMQLLARNLGKLCELHFIPLNKNPFTKKSKRELLELLVAIQPDVFHCRRKPWASITISDKERINYSIRIS